MARYTTPIAPSPILSMIWYFPIAVVTCYGFSTDSSARLDQSSKDPS